MKYIEKNESVTREYEVVINDVELENIIKELNENCCRAIKKSVRVTSGSKEEAIKRINSANNHGINVVRELEMGDSYNHLKTFSKPQYVYECEFYFKQVSYLAYLLTIALNSYRSKLGFTTDDNRTIDLILNYENNEELKSYKERMAEQGITEDLYFEYENNKDFDFELLKELYEKAKECFRLVLISETIHYDDAIDQNRVYKLGRK